MNLKTYFLHDINVRYWMENSMRNGPSLTLSQLAVDEWDWSRCKFITYAYDNLSAEKLSNFKEGGKSDSRKSDFWLFNWAKNNFSDGEYFFIVENWLLVREYQFLITENFPYFMIGNELYYYVNVNNKLNRVKLARIFSNVSPSFHAYVVPSKIALKLICDKSKSVLYEVSKEIMAIICGAYDGESYVISYKT